jgi:hypothetical protein
MSKRFLFFVLLMISTSISAYCLPRFASRTNATCSSCHINPTGGEMRNLGGVMYGREQLPIRSWEEKFGLEDFSTQLTSFISYGLDFRFLYFYQRKDRPDTIRSSFFPMQADVYLNLNISKKVSVFVNPAFGPFNRYEIFGIARIFPSDGYLRLGRFTVPYGLRFDDHTSYIRDATPFRNNEGQQTGIEAEISPGAFGFLAAVTNGTVVAAERAIDVAKAFILRVDWRESVGPLNVLIGGSSYSQVTGGDNLHLLGGFGSVSWNEKLTLIGDVERISGNSTSMSVSGERGVLYAGGAEMKQLAVLVEADFLLFQGLDLKFLYDFFDPNTDLKAGVAKRYSVGFEFFPMSGVEVRPLLRRTNDTVVHRNTTDLQVLVHFYI